MGIMWITGGREYIWKLKMLYDVALGNLGPMDTGNYASFMSRARTLATEKGVKNPLLVIDIKLKTPNALGSKEQPYPISDEEWAIFVRDGRTLAEYMPNVYVVDGDKYIAPI